MNAVAAKNNLHNSLRLFAGIGLLSFAAALTGAQAIEEWIGRNCANCEQRMTTQTGAYILEKGEEALLGRAWLTQHAETSIDVQ